MTYKISGRTRMGGEYKLDMPREKLRDFVRWCLDTARKSVERGDHRFAAHHLDIARAIARETGDSSLLGACEDVDARIDFEEKD